MLKRYNPASGNPLFVRMIAYPLSGGPPVGEITTEIQKNDAVTLVETPDYTVVGKSDSITRVLCQVDLPTFSNATDGLLLRASVSMNGLDFCDVSHEAVIAHACSPHTIRPNCLSVLHKPMDMIITGTGFPPSTIVETLVRCRAENSPACIMIKATSSKSSELIFPSPNIHDLVESTENQINLIVDVIINGVAVNESPLSVMLYHPMPVHASTDVYYYRGGADLYLRGEGICVFSENSRIQINSGTNLPFFVNVEIVCLDDGGFEGKATLPSLIDIITEESHSDLSKVSSFMLLHILLDGVTLPPDNLAIKLSLCYGVKNITCKSPPKSGFSVNSSVVCLAQGLVGGQTSIARIFGADEGSFLQIPTLVNTDDSTFSFILPEEINTLTPEEQKGKVKYFFISISLDGGFNFDRSETAVLPIK